LKKISIKLSNDVSVWHRNFRKKSRENGLLTAYAGKAFGLNNNSFDETRRRDTAQDNDRRRGARRNRAAASLPDPSMALRTVVGK
jgi:hypothetical protein